MCKAGWYRLASFLSIIAANVVTISLVYLAPFLHPKEKGTVTSQEADAVAFTVLVTFLLPCLGLLGIYYKVRGWDRFKGEMMYIWQAWTSLALSLAIALVAVVGLLLIVLNVDYLEPPGPGGQQPANPQPVELSFAYHAQRLFLYLGLFLTLALAMGLLSPAPDAVTHDPD